MAPPERPAVKALLWNLMATVAGVAAMLISLGFWTWTGVGPGYTVGISMITTLVVITSILLLYDRAGPGRH